MWDLILSPKSSLFTVLHFGSSIDDSDFFAGRNALVVFNWTCFALRDPQDANSSFAGLRGWKCQVSRQCNREAGMVGEVDQVA
jgi:hypothetical protein